MTLIEGSSISQAQARLTEDRAKLVARYLSVRLPQRTRRPRLGIAKPGPAEWKLVNGEAVYTPKGAETPVDKPVDNIVDTNPVNKPPVDTHVDSKPPVVDSKEQRRIYQREWLRNKRAGLTAISS